MDYKNSKWAQEIVALQKDDGTWGQYFHTLSIPIKTRPLTTEQALRRLRILGFTIKDEPIRKAVEYMVSCLRGERKMDDSWEKTHNWALFTQLMLSAWVKVFEPNNELALRFAKRWEKVVERAFESGYYKQNDYENAYVNEFSSKPNGGREKDATAFYHMVLLQGVLTKETESRLLDYIIAKPDGIYYVYSKPISNPPETFTSREASWYLTALEILSNYKLAGDKLNFAVNWLNINKDVNGQWDFGAKAKDEVHFPLSDSWKNAEDRKADCTERVTTFLRKMNVL